MQLALNVRDLDKAVAFHGKLFAALAEGGEGRMPLGETFFAKCFGTVADRFGLGWMVILAHKAADNHDRISPNEEERREEG